MGKCILNYLVAQLFCKCNLEDYLGLYGQVTKRIRWMPWRQKAMKDVVVCDKPRGDDKHSLIRGFPNGETHSV